MSFLKNVKVSVKLSLIIGPLILMLGVLVFLLNYMSNQILIVTRTTYYEETFRSTDNIINADRDLYQALLAEKEYYLSRSH